MTTKTPSSQDAALARDEAILLLRTSGVDQLESLQLILDAAVLAVEQVQDKRLELLEEGPEVTTTDVVLEFATVLLLDLKVVGRVVQGITQRALAHRVAQQRLTAGILSQVSARTPNLPRGVRVGPATARAIGPSRRRGPAAPARSVGCWTLRPPGHCAPTE